MTRITKKRNYNKKLVNSKRITLSTQDQKVKKKKTQQSLLTTKNLLIGAIGIASIGIGIGIGVSDIGTVSQGDKLKLNHASNLRQAVKKNAYRDVNEMRSVRQEYAMHSEKQKKHYDYVANKTIDCFTENQSHKKEWNEEKVIMSLHECGLENGYPKMKALTDNTLKGKTMIDYVRLDNAHNILDLYHSEPTFDIVQESLNVLRGTDEGTNIMVLNQSPIAYIMPLSDRLMILRSPLIPLTSLKQEAILGDETRKTAQKFILPELNEIATNLLEGNFKNQDDAIDKLLTYKYLTSIPFSIENMRGTQFKNIAKINYLVETLKNKFPDKISADLTIPHKFNHSHKDLQNPELAVLFKTIDDFKEMQKQQIQAHKAKA